MKDRNGKRIRVGLHKKQGDGPNRKTRREMQTWGRRPGKAKPHFHLSRDMARQMIWSKLSKKP